jgi:hypothetical protein
VEAARDESFGTGDQCLQIELVPLSEPAEDLITGSLPSVGAANVRVRSGTSPAFQLRFTSKRLQAFDAAPYAEAAIRLRLYDDRAKVPDAESPDLGRFAPLMTELFCR